MASLGDSVELLGFGEALHSGEDILILRNGLFKPMVEAYGYRIPDLAAASAGSARIESSWSTDSQSNVLHFVLDKLHR
jgi:hypothetical protein